MLVVTTTALTFRVALVSQEAARRHVLGRLFRSAGPVDVFAHHRAVVPRLPVVPGHHLEPAGDRVQVQYRVVRVPGAVRVDPHAARHACGSG